MSSEYDRPTSSASAKPGASSSSVPLLSDVEAPAANGAEKAPGNAEAVKNDNGTFSGAGYKIAFSHFVVWIYRKDGKGYLTE